MASTKDEFGSIPHPRESFDDTAIEDWSQKTLSQDRTTNFHHLDGLATPDVQPVQYRTSKYSTAPMSCSRLRSKQATDVDSPLTKTSARKLLPGDTINDTDFSLQD